MSKALIKFVIVGIVALFMAVFRWQAKRRANAAELVGGCVACGSQRVAVEEHSRTCLECGFVGQPDGGGMLSAHEIDAMYDHREQRRDW